MQKLPHQYSVLGQATLDSDVTLSMAGVTSIDSAPPVEFGGPGDKWSPESLLVAAIADCFILSFKAISRASKFDWLSLECDVEGILDQDQNDKRMQFTHYNLHASLLIAQSDKHALAKRLLEKAKQSCLITNSLSGETSLTISIREAQQ